MGRQKAQGQQWEGLKVVHPNAAGLDIGSEEIWVAVAPSAGAAAVRKFGTFTPDLVALADWLAAHGVETVAMESTGVYWIPVYEILEERRFEVAVVNARHLKNVPGRKSDIQDCQWIQGLHSVGLLRASFRPEADYVALRTYLRHRATLIEYRAAHIQQMQKALQQMNLQLTQVLSDITGVTGLTIIRAIIAGERDPQRLAAFRQGNCKQNEETIAKALTGNYRREHLFALEQAVALYDFYTKQLQRCDGEIEQQFTNLKPSDDALPPLPPSTKTQTHSKNAPPYDARTLLYQLTAVDLVAIPGLNESTVQTIIAELGSNVDAFPTVKHFCSWVGLAPHNDISGGKRLRSRTLPTNNRVGQAFRIAAQSVAKSPQSAFGAFYRRMKGRLGTKQAIVATAHKIARAFYFVLKHRVPFDDLGGEEYERLATERERKRLVKRAAKLGLALVPAS
ncbi:MAG: IS110 family transposase [Caldilineaceae bacterium]|nr:IS110 family transposase [Caldilineaceae bacterium]MCB0127380.1 IS110 family transposase [Caldilineaceae bacterium]